ncbi:hypothetical protein ACFY9F_12195 [Streptomyces sp. NPDC012421]|uniref:hypothetical protein n=1 Tax=Streptomyces sp. NPDC012421 TaxID=3364832 RepID=UPI0036EB5DF6
MGLPERSQPVGQGGGGEFRPGQADGDAQGREHADPGDRPEGELPARAADQRPQRHAERGREGEPAQNERQCAAPPFGRHGERRRAGGGGRDDPRADGVPDHEDGRRDQQRRPPVQAARERDWPAAGVDTPKSAAMEGAGPR